MTRKVNPKAERPLRLEGHGKALTRRQMLGRGLLSGAGIVLAPSLASMLIPVVVVTLAMSIPIVAIITEHLQKKEKMRLIAMAIEHGAELEGLDLDEPEAVHIPYRSGMVTLAVGIALILMVKSGNEKTQRNILIGLKNIQANLLKVNLVIIVLIKQKC